ncbi:MAG: glycosyltransferase [Clostridiales bacterium]|jgi:glycosyltransferase involved in cell wall biosynthesis|nr:glycosyltransferase [Clostridiales bacterium]
MNINKKYLGVIGLFREFLNSFKNFAFKENIKTLFNMYERKFLEYKKNRNNLYYLKFSDISCQCVEGLVSVVIPVYNGSGLIEKSIESVLKQSYKNFELIVVNDGSTDNTFEILKKYEKIDHRITVLNQKNEKIPRALSKGFSVVKGEFYTWTSSDNIMKNNFLEKMVQELVNDSECAMVYANMKLIDAKGKILRGHGWYEYPMASGNVILPSDTLQLNTQANNTIGAAFMYRAIVGKMIGDYSPYKYTLEDYDYWMKINSLFKIKHVSFFEPIYYYRMHQKSLTSQDKELGITKNRYKLMVLDDFRRDFFLSPILWYIKGECKNSQEFRNIIAKKGHVCINEKQLKDFYFTYDLKNICVVNFINSEEMNNFEKKGFSTEFFVSENSKIDNYYKFFVQINHNFFKEKICFKIGDLNSLFSFIDAKKKIFILNRFESKIESDSVFFRKLSVILCTHKKSSQLIECLNSLCKQSVEASVYEIVFVDNSCKEESELKNFFNEIKCKNLDINFKYISMPIQGLSYARNVGLWNASGEIVLYIDDDAIADTKLIEETYDCFSKNKKDGIIGGQIILKYDERPEVLEEGLEPLWSEFVLKGDEYSKAKNYGSFPYGANFAARTKLLRQIGGFRVSYGRKLDNYAGGEEIAACFLMESIGMGIGLNPKSIVYHCVDRSRYTLKHIYKTAFSGVITAYRLRKDLYAPFDWSENVILNKVKYLKYSLSKYQFRSPGYIKIKAEIAAYENVLKDMRCVNT